MSISSIPVPAVPRIPGWAKPVTLASWLLLVGLSVWLRQQDDFFLNVMSSVISTIAGAVFAVFGVSLAFRRWQTRNRRIQNRDLVMHLLNETSKALEEFMAAVSAPLKLVLSCTEDGAVARIEVIAHVPQNENHRTVRDVAGKQYLYAKLWAGRTTLEVGRGHRDRSPITMEAIERSVPRILDSDVQGPGDRAMRALVDLATFHQDDQLGSAIIKAMSSISAACYAWREGIRRYRSAVVDLADRPGDPDLEVPRFRQANQTARAKAELIDSAIGVVFDLLIALNVGERPMDKLTELFDDTASLPSHWETARIPAQLKSSHREFWDMLTRLRRDDVSARLAAEDLEGYEEKPLPVQ